MEKNDFEERAGLLALNKVFGFEPAAGRRLLEELGSASAAFGMKREELRAVIGPYPRLLDGLVPASLDSARKELEWLDSRHYRFIGISEPDYPQMLKECEDPPLGLYYRSQDGMGEIFGKRPAVAIVGTRDISGYGRQWCRSIVQAMASCPEKPVIVSGLALGTDSVAQRTALEEGLPTVGVMATGIDSVYPYRHIADADRMAITPGCAVLTDYPPGTQPLAIHFLRRNRIIAGLCSATILVESKIRGGGMMTARLAYSYERDVYALPGRIDDVRSGGCNYLLREKIAEPVTDVADLMERLGLGHSSVKRRDIGEEIRSGLGKIVTGEKLERLVEMAGMIRKKGGISLPEICGMTGWSWSEVMSCAGLLENEGLIETDLLQKCWIKPKNL